MRDSIVIAGSLAQKPHQAGHTWQFLQYLLGFRELGWEVLFVDRLEPDMCVNGDGLPCPVEESLNLSYLAQVMAEFGLDDSWTLLCGDGSQVHGRSRAKLLERVRGAALLLNVMGFLTDEDILAAAPRRVFLDTDPGFGQMWRELGLADLFAGHDDYVTIAENIGRPDCGLPTCGVDWITTPQPVVVDLWRCDSAPGEAFTSVGAWRGPYAPVEYEGTTYGLRVHEFRRFVDLPARTGEPFEVALSIDEGDEADRDRLVECGWRLVDPRGVASDVGAYRSYIARSRGEFMVAKNMYVDTRSGWFSDRSACYLASGRPVLAQDTGYTDDLPTGAGLFPFTTLDDAAAAVEEISAKPAEHRRAARELAEAHFDAPLVIERLLTQLQTGTSTTDD
jgi:hypothetical protein